MNVLQKIEKKDFNKIKKPDIIYRKNRILNTNRGSIMEIGTWNLDYWRRVFDYSKNKELYRTKEQIQDYKTSTVKIIKECDFDFLLLQETNPFFYFC
jgi:hypothetical protein